MEGACSLGAVGVVVVDEADADDSPPRPQTRGVFASSASPPPASSSVTCQQICWAGVYLIDDGFGKGLTHGAWWPMRTTGRGRWRGRSVRFSETVRLHTCNCVPSLRSLCGGWAKEPNEKVHRRRGKTFLLSRWSPTLDTSGTRARRVECGWLACSESIGTHTRHAWNPCPACRVWVVGVQVSVASIQFQWRHWGSVRVQSLSRSLGQPRTLPPVLSDCDRDTTLAWSEPAHGRADHELLAHELFWRRVSMG